MPRAYLSLGSNLGDRAANLRQAVRLLSGHPDITPAAVSPLYETEPVGVKEQPQFLNMVLAIDTSLSPRQLLAYCQSVEQAMGRVRSERWGPRVIDIDILLMNGIIWQDEVLQLPHPRMLERRFVLQPLCDIAPDLLIAGRKARDHLAELRDNCTVVLAKEVIDLASL